MLLTDPVVLENPYVRLEPLDASHSPGLDIASQGLEYAWYTSVPAAASIEIEHRLAEHAAGRMNPFAVVAGGRPVGMTTLCNIDQPNRRTELGYTWLSPTVQRTAVNTAAVTP